MQPQKPPAMKIQGVPGDITLPDIQFVPIPPAHQQAMFGQHPAATPQHPPSPPAYTAPAYQPPPQSVPVAQPVQPPSPERIFRFWDGTQWAYMDPIEVTQGLTVELDNPDEMIDAMYAQRPKLDKTTKKPILVPRRDAQGREIPGQTDPVMELNPDVAYPALARVMAAVRKVLGIPAIDRTTGQGVGQSVPRKALEDFLDFLDQKKSSTASPPTSAPSSASAPSSVPVPSPTMHSSDSGSTSGGCGCS